MTGKTASVCMDRFGPLQNLWVWKNVPSIHILHGHPQALHAGGPAAVSVLCGPNSVQRFQTQKSSLHAQQVLKQT